MTLDLDLPIIRAAHAPGVCAVCGRHVSGRAHRWHTDTCPIVAFARGDRPDPSARCECGDALACSHCCPLCAAAHTSQEAQAA